ncbi:MAG: hypothetical protein R3B47_12910 [Bacteroidia bacterium]
MNMEGGKSHTIELREEFEDVGKGGMILFVKIVYLSTAMDQTIQLFKSLPKEMQEVSKDVYSVFSRKNEN